MAIKVRAAHREQTAAWLTASFLVLALALAPSPGHDDRQRSFASAVESVEATLSPLVQRAVAMIHLDPLRPWLLDPLDDTASADSYD